MTERPLVLGTAGHIDHGKTALIKAMTGVDTDRLKEEKERGITTELGFTHLTLPSGNEVGIVDVPGHEKFVRHMVAGASGIDCVLLVVAADEGVMPQTVEHVQICRLLGVKKGLIAITKCDLVDKEMQELVREDIRDLVKGTFLENAPVYSVSSVTREGIPELVQAIEDVTKNMQQRETEQIFRLPIDRVFTMKGFGTVITGTLISGELQTGDEIEILPSGKRCRVRGIQVHNQRVDVSFASQRTAVNLLGVEKGEVQRGEVLVHPGTLEPTHRLDGFLTVLPTAEHPITHASIHRFHVGTSLHLARIYLMDAEQLGPSEEGYAQFVFKEPVIALPGDRFVVRGSGRIQTLGGGEILSVHPPRRKRGSRQTLESLRLLREGTKREKVLFYIRENGIRGVTFPRLMELTNLSRTELTQTLEKAVGASEVARIDLTSSVYLHTDLIKDLSRKIEEALRVFHVSNPLVAGIEKEVLRSRLVPELDKKIWDYLLMSLQNDGMVVLEKEVVSLKSYQASIDPNFQKDINAVRGFLQKGRSKPPTLKELSVKLGKASDELKRILTYLVKKGECVKLTEEIYMDRKAYEEIRKETVDFLLKNGEITVQSFKELTGLSRKFAVPILELFDKERVTLRLDQKRVLRN